MIKRRLLLAIAIIFVLFAQFALANNLSVQNGKMPIAIIGLDHDHVWELLRYIAGEDRATLVGIAEADHDLVEKAKSQVPATARFYSDYVRMLDEVKPELVFVTTRNDRHLEILRECVRRHIHYSTEKPMATSAAEAREMEHLANGAGIKLMVNYWNAWTASSRDLHARVKSGEIGPVENIIVQYGHEGPKEIGVSKQFSEWLYDPVRNGGGAIMDFGCYGAEWALWLKGRPQSVYATARKLKTEQHNKVDDDSTIELEYPDAAVIIEASWDWPYSMDRVYVFGPKGGLLATRDDLFLRASPQNNPPKPEGERLTLGAIAPDISNPVAYLLACIRQNKAVEDPVSAKLNVQVMEILDAARESVRTGRRQTLP